MRWALVPRSGPDDSASVVRSRRLPDYDRQMDTFHADYRSELLPPDNEYRVETSVFVEGKLWTLNAERSDHYAVHRRRTKEWREGVVGGMPVRLRIRW